MNEKIKCPICLSELIVTHRDSYQDLLEHVESPNSRPSMKDGYQCPKEDCVAHIGKAVWILSGEYFSALRPHEISYEFLKDLLEARNGSSAAVGSWQHFYEVGQILTKKRIVKVNLFKYQIKITPKTKRWKENTHDHYSPHPWKKRIEIYKKEGDNLIYIVPFNHFFKYRRDNFNLNYKQWKEKGSKKALLEAIYYADSRNKFTLNVEPGFNSRMTSIIIHILYPNKIKSLNKELLKINNEKTVTNLS